MLSKDLSLPIAKIIRRVLDTSDWFEMWMQHWICPLFKRGSVADPENNRGVHLPSQISKVIESVGAYTYYTFREKIEFVYMIVRKSAKRQ